MIQIAGSVLLKDYVLFTLLQWPGLKFSFVYSFLCTSEAVEVIHGWRQQLPWKTTWCVTISPELYSLCPHGAAKHFKHGVKIILNLPPSASWLMHCSLMLRLNQEVSYNAIQFGGSFLEMYLWLLLSCLLSGSNLANSVEKVDINTVLCKAKIKLYKMFQKMDGGYWQKNATENK